MAALADLRGRRALVLAERLLSAEEVPQDECEGLLARGHEAYLRELFGKGHAQQACKRALALLERNPEFSKHWAMSFRLRLGVIECSEQCLSDPAWVAQLRMGLVNPEDLLETATGGLAEQAQLVMQAWGALENEQISQARELLHGIGRRSPLVDWRLFIEILAAYRSDSVSEAEVAFRRMLPNCPVWQLARTVLEDSAPTCELESTNEVLDENELAIRLADLQKKFDAVGKVAKAQLPILDGVITCALQQQRPHLALTVLTSYVQNDARHGLHMDEFLRTNLKRWSPLNSSRLFIRASVSDSSENLSSWEILEYADMSFWNKKERALLCLKGVSELQKEIQLENEDLDSYVDFASDDEMSGDLAEIVTYCRKAINYDSTLREIYTIWDWAEQQQQSRKFRAAQAFCRAFPRDIEAQEMLILRAAKAGVNKQVEAGLNRLRDIPGTRAVVARLEHTVIYLAVKNAFEAGKFDAVESLGCKYQDGQLFEMVNVAVYRWMAAQTNKDRRLRGLDLAALNSPWLVFYTCREIDSTLQSNRLPAAIKRGLKNDHDGVLNGFCAFVDYNRNITVRDKALLTPLIAAIGNPATSLVELCKVLTVVLSKNMRELFYLANEELMRAVLRLLNADEDSQSLGLLLRASMFHGPRRKDKPIEACLSASWNLADSQEMKSLIISVANQKFADIRGFRRAQHAKTVQRELKKQRKLKTGKALDKHFNVPFTRSPFSPFRRGSGEDPIEKILKQMIENGYFGDEDFDDEWSDAEPEDEPILRKVPDLSKCHPGTSMEFELLMEQGEIIHDSSERYKFASTLADMIEKSVLTERAKTKLAERCRKMMS